MLAILGFCGRMHQTMKRVADARREVEAMIKRMEEDMPGRIHPDLNDEDVLARAKKIDPDFDDHPPGYQRDVLEEAAEQLIDEKDQGVSFR